MTAPDGLSDSPAQLAQEILGARMEDHTRFMEMDAAVKGKQVNPEALETANSDIFNFFKAKLSGYDIAYDHDKIPPSDLMAAALIPGIAKPFRTLSGSLGMIAKQGALSPAAKAGINGKALSYALPLVNLIGIFPVDSSVYFQERLDFYKGFDEKALRNGDTEALNRLAASFALYEYTPKEFFTPYDIEELLRKRQPYLNSDPKTIEDYEKKIGMLQNYIKPRLKKLGELLDVPMHTELPQGDLAPQAKALLETKINDRMNFGQLLAEAATWKWKETSFLDSLPPEVKTRYSDPDKLRQISNYHPSTLLSLKTLHAGLANTAEGQPVRPLDRMESVLMSVEFLMEKLAARLEKDNCVAEAAALRDTIIPKFESFTVNFGHIMPHDRRGRSQCL